MSPRKKILQLKDLNKKIITNIEKDYLLMTIDQIIHKYNISIRTFYSLKSRGSIPEKEKTWNIKICKTEYKKIKELYELGLTCRDVGKIYNVDQNTISGIINSIGVKRDKGLKGDKNYRYNGGYEKKLELNIPRAKTRKLIKSGKIIRKESCEQCNVKCKTEAHHEDYSNIYDVTFLCNSCHQKLHAKKDSNKRLEKARKAGLI